jgi:hypothetical protein
LPELAVRREGVARARDGQLRRRIFP